MFNFFDRTVLCFGMGFLVTFATIQSIQKKEPELNKETIIKLERCQVELEVYKSEMNLTLREPVEIIRIGEN